MFQHFGTKLCPLVVTVMYLLTLFITFYGFITVGGEIVFNVKEKVHLGKDSLSFTCLVKPSVKVDELYFIKFSRLHNNNEWGEILLLRPNISNLDLFWKDKGFEDRTLTNTSKTEGGILWLNIPLEQVLHNDSGTYRCFAKWLTHGLGRFSSHATQTVEVVEVSSLPSMSTTESNTHPSYKSSTPETTVESISPGHITTSNGSYASKSPEGDKENGKVTSYWIIAGPSVFIAVLLLVAFIFLLKCSRRGRSASYDMRTDNVCGMCQSCYCKKRN